MSWRMSRRRSWHTAALLLSAAVCQGRWAEAYRRKTRRCDRYLREEASLPPLSAKDMSVRGAEQSVDISTDEMYARAEAKSPRDLLKKWAAGEDQVSGASRQRGSPSRLWLGASNSSREKTEQLSFGQCLGWQRIPARYVGMAERRADL